MSSSFLFLEHFYISGKLPTYPSPKPTLILTSHLGQNVALGRGRWAVSQECIMIPFFFHLFFFFILFFIPIFSIVLLLLLLLLLLLFVISS